MITADRMAAVDRNAAALGVTEKQLMESSGNAVAQLVRDLGRPGESVSIVAGRGNNGGDGFVAARFLDAFDITVYLLGRPEFRTETARENWEALLASEHETQIVRDSSVFELGSPDIVIDAVLGTGISGAPREPERTAIESINESNANIVSIDIPSGMNADTGEIIDVAVDANHVVTFHDYKPGLVDREGVRVVDIGIPAAAETFVGPGDLLFHDRDPQSHKGAHGRVFVIGGGPYTGAPALSAQAALRAGADLVYVAAPETVTPEIQGYSEDLITEPYAGNRLTPEHVDSLLDTANDRDVTIIGPGLGKAEITRDAIRAFLSEFDGTAVVDADALQVVPEVETDATLICTPHKGEFQAMGGVAASDWREQSDLVEKFADALGQIILLKGAYDVISDGGFTRINRTGNPGMTVGGTGDVLAGVTGGLLAIREPMTAAAVGAYATGLAGDRVFDELGNGLVASDLLSRLPTTLRGQKNE